MLPEIPEDQLTFHEVIGGEDEPGERLDEIAARYYGEPGLWRVIAVYNGVADPLQVPPPQVLRIPPLDAVRALAMTLAVLALPRVIVEVDGGQLACRRCRGADRGRGAPGPVGARPSASSRSSTRRPTPTSRRPALPGGVAPAPACPTHDQAAVRWRGHGGRARRTSPTADAMLRVRGYDRLHRLRKRGEPRVHLDVTPSALASELAGAVGLSVDAPADGPARRPAGRSTASPTSSCCSTCAERTACSCDVRRRHRSA